MQIIVNSKPIEVAVNCTISALVEQLNLDIKRIAIEYNREILSPEQFHTTIMNDNDCIEIVNFVGGG
ncbi:MAG: sulfur carrier protein ThiS [Desulfuromonas sp.]|nr:sulfur carrier protein ThiS [Desulfuromonas sp.]